MRSVYHKRLYDADLIKEFLTTEELWGKISESSQKPEELVIPIDDLIHWVGLYNVTDVLVGIFALHPQTITTCVTHINILEEYRRAYGLPVGLAVLNYMLYSTDYNKFNAEIAVIYPNVLKYTEYFGYKQEGVNRKSINKNNELIDQIYYGVTRTELSQHLTTLLKKL
jgi:RimJ/RimL family protein N-acetyltransferase